MTKYYQVIGKFSIAFYYLNKVAVSNDEFYPMVDLFFRYKFEIKHYKDIDQFHQKYLKIHLIVK